MSGSRLPGLDNSSRLASIYVNSPIAPAKQQGYPIPRATTAAWLVMNHHVDVSIPCSYMHTVNIFRAGFHSSYQDNTASPCAVQPSLPPHLM